MRLTVLGKSPSWQDVNGACSSYLVEHESCRLVLDCGNGAFAKLRRFADYLEVDAVVVSHMHADHFLDLIPYSYALTYTPRRQPVADDGAPESAPAVRPRLLAPPDATEVLRRVVGAWGNEELVEKAFRVEEYAADSELEIGPFTIAFSPVPHFLDTFAISVRAGGVRLVYGADSRPAPELVEFARDADLFLIEATLSRPERDGVRGHLTAAEAGQHGRAANAKRLVLTHISDELDQDEARRLAEESFGGPVEVAAEGVAYDL